MKILNSTTRNYFLKITVIVSLFAVIIPSINSCKKEIDPTPPVLTTVNVSGLTQTGAVSGGNITSDGGASIIARGVCWSNSSNPTVEGSHTNDGIEVGSFTSAITGLTPNTLYYIKSYATNSVGTAYGNELSFTTNPVLLATLITTIPSLIGSTTAASGGNITSDGGGSLTATGVCWSTAINPSITDSHTTEGTSTGSFNSNLTGLSMGTYYYVRAYATNGAGTAYGNQITFNTLIADIEGSLYKIVTIGTQVWMAENLRTSKYNDGSSIPLIADNTEWSNLHSPGYCWYDNDPDSYKNTYGALYNWYTINTGKLAPKGWHVPTDAEWTTLTTYLGGGSVAGGKLKEVGFIHWSGNEGATNETGFTALPGGDRDYIGRYMRIGYYGTWQTSSLYVSGKGLYWMMYNNQASITQNSSSVQNGYSVRCLKDN
jgi:uncharacterized protein (TIGR02145 family)